jgi:flagellin-like protein
MNYRKFRKNAKALSPVIATIILIAVTVAVSVVVAAWMGALTIGFMGNSEQASITNTVFNSATSVTVTVQNTGGATVTLTSASIAGLTVATVNGNAVPLTSATYVTVTKGSSTTFAITVSASTPFVNTAQYQISLQTAKGNTVTTTATYTGS